MKSSFHHLQDSADSLERFHYVRGSLLANGVRAERLGLVGLEGFDFRDTLGRRAERGGFDVRGERAIRAFIGLGDVEG